MSTYDVDGEAIAILEMPTGTFGERAAKHAAINNAIQRAYNAGCEAGLSRAEEVTREYLGHLDREDISPLIRIAVRETANRIASARERTPALCAETGKHRDFCNTTFLSPPNDCNCDAKGAAEPTPREPRKGDVWRDDDDQDWEFSGRHGPFGWHAQTTDGKKMAMWDAVAFTDGTLTFVRRAASGTPGDAK